MEASRPPPVGWPAEPNQKFCPAVAIAKYPYKHVSLAMKGPCSTDFFTDGKFWATGWDLYYLHHSTAQGPKILYLLPLNQVATFFNRINAFYKSSVTRVIAFSHDAVDQGLILDFNSPEAMPRPRYLGVVDNQKAWQNVSVNTPGSKYTPELSGIPLQAMEAPRYTSAAMTAFAAKCELAVGAGSKQSKATRDRKKAEKIAKRVECGRQVRRCQRYLGIRHGSVKSQLRLDVNIPPSFVPDMQVKFVCIDVEAYEKNHHCITEIGVATLDTADIIDVAPGKFGQGWRDLIRARHFRIKEYRHYRNSDFVRGCPDSFSFGDSEFISLKDAASKVASCFVPGSLETTIKGSDKSDMPPNMATQPIVFVGHNVGADITFLRSLGFDLLSQPYLLEILDTALMFRSHKRSANTSSLAAMLYDLNIDAWFLHNAGNDAAYTLQGMLGLCVDAITHPYAGVKNADEKRMLVEELYEEAVEKVQEDEEGWDLADDDNGGGPTPWGRGGKDNKANASPSTSKAPEDPEEKAAKRAIKFGKAKGADHETLSIQENADKAHSEVQSHLKMALSGNSRNEIKGPPTVSPAGSTKDASAAADLIDLTSPVMNSAKPVSPAPPATTTPLPVSRDAMPTHAALQPSNVALPIRTREKDEPEHGSKQKAAEKTETNTPKPASPGQVSIQSEASDSSNDEPKAAPGDGTKDKDGDKEDGDAKVKTKRKRNRKRKFAQAAARSSLLKKDSDKKDDGEAAVQDSAWW